MDVDEIEREIERRDLEIKRMLLLMKWRNSLANARRKENASNCSTDGSASDSVCD